jgi:hypothetical protein
MAKKQKNVKVSMKTQTVKSAYTIQKMRWDDAATNMSCRVVDAEGKTVAVFASDADAVEYVKHKVYCNIEFSIPLKQNVCDKSGENYHITGSGILMSTL